MFPSTSFGFAQDKTLRERKWHIPLAERSRSQQRAFNGEL